MRATIVLLVIGAFLALAGAPPALAASSKSFSGEISKIDSAAKSVVVKAKGTPAKQMTFEVAPDAKIMMGAKALDLTRLKDGEHVKVTYLDEGMHHKAHKIEVMPPKTAAARPTRKSMAP